MREFFEVFLFMLLFLYCCVVVLVIEDSPNSTSPVQCHVQGSVRLYSDEEITLSTNFDLWGFAAVIVFFGYKSRVCRTHGYGESDFIGLGRLSKSALALWDFIKSRKKSALSDLKMET